MYENNAFGIDISKYDTVKWEELRGKVDFVIAKMGGSEDGLYEDVKFSSHIEGAYNIGAIPMAYWFVAPRFWLEQMQTAPGIEQMPDDKHPILQRIMNSLRNKAVYALFFDVEDFSLTTKAGNVTDFWLKFYISDLIERLRRQMAKGNMKPIKLGVYSRRTFIDQYAKSLDIWLGTQPDLAIWCANWAGSGSITGTIDVLKADKLTDGHSPRSFGWSPDRPKTWTFWQYSGDSGRVRVCTSILSSAGSPRAVDLNFFNGTPEELKKWAGVTQSTPQPQPQPQPEPQPQPQPEPPQIPADVYQKINEMYEIAKRFERLWR